MSKPQYPARAPSPSIDLNRALPKNIKAWPIEVQAYVPLLVSILEDVRYDMARPFARGLIPESAVIDAIRARALETLARSQTPIDGPTYARAVARLILALSIDE